MTNEMRFEANDPSAVTRGDKTTITADAGATKLILSVPSEQWNALLDRRLQERLETIGDTMRDRYEAFKQEMTDAGQDIANSMDNFTEDVRKQLSIKNRRTSTTAEPEPEEEPEPEPEEDEAVTTTH